jgi:hypothetical protein
LTSADSNIAAFAAACRDASGDDTLRVLHRMLERLNEKMAFDVDPTHAATTAAEAFALKCGVCQDITQVFIAATRILGIPARYVGGYFLRGDGITEQEAGRPCLGGGVCAGARLGCFRRGKRHLRHRCSCPGCSRTRLSRGCPVARRATRSSWRIAIGESPGHPSGATSAKLSQNLPTQ